MRLKKKVLSDPEVQAHTKKHFQIENNLNLFDNSYPEMLKDDRKNWILFNRVVM